MINTNSTKYLKSFVILEEYIKRRSNKGLGFERSVNDLVSKSDPIITHFQHDLRQFGKLRNAIVHREKDGRVIAEPTDWAVEEFEDLKERVINPPIVNNLITDLEQDLLIIETGTRIDKTLYELNKRSYSQVPVYNEDRFMDLLTTDTISRWLSIALHNKDNLNEVKSTLVDTVLTFTENVDNCCFMKSNDTVIDIINAFDQSERESKPLDAILITQFGNQSEKLIGILTVWDIPRCLNLIT